MLAYAICWSGTIGRNDEDLLEKQSSSADCIWDAHFIYLRGVTDELHALFAVELQTN